MAKYSHSILRIIYRSIRSIVFSLTLVVVGFYVLTYILLAIPGFTNYVKDIATQRLSEFLGAEVDIESLNIYPFNEVKINGLEVLDQEGEKCLEVQTIGAGISVWKLITKGEIILTFGEIIGLKADIVQKEKDAPLNIQFIIDAFSSKEKKEQKDFSLALRNVVIRKSSASFSRPWLKDSLTSGIDLSSLKIENMAADITFPKISNKGIDIDLRRLSLSLVGFTDIKRLSFKGSFSPERIKMDNFILELPASRIHIPELNLEPEPGKDLKDALANNDNIIEITDSYITPSDFSIVYSPLKNLNQRLNLLIKAEGNKSSLIVNDFNFGNPELLYLNFKGDAFNLDNPENLEASISGLSFYASSYALELVRGLHDKIPDNILTAIENLGFLNISGDVDLALNSKSVSGNLDLISEAFQISCEGETKPSGSLQLISGEISVNDLNLKRLIPSMPVGIINADITTDAYYSEKFVEGSLNLNVENFELKGRHYEGFALNFNKEGEIFEGDVQMTNALAGIKAKFSGDLSEEEKKVRLDMDLNNLNLSEFIDMKDYRGYLISGTVNLDASGNNAEDFYGDLWLNNFSFASPDKSRSLKLNSLNINTAVEDSIRKVVLISDWVNLKAEGNIKPKFLVPQVEQLASSVFPALLPAHKNIEPELLSDIDLDIQIKNNNTLIDFFKMPVRLLAPVSISGSLQGSLNSASLTVDVPYLQQGKDKLIYDSRIVTDIDGVSGTLNGYITTTMPVKKGDLALNVNLFGKDNTLSTDLHFINTENSDFKGFISLETELAKNPFHQNPEIKLSINPSVVQMGPADWNIAGSTITYADKTVDIKGFKVWHDQQLVEINGKASADYKDVVTLNLADIDVDYIFGLLQINYVTFGGVATGEITGHSLLSGSPVAETESLLIKQFTYNGTDLGVCYASSHWNNEEKEIEIGADIFKDGRQIVKGGGGIWLGRDSLSFDIKANKVPTDFVQPFMSVFSSHVGGYASGDVKLFGTFHDIDMTGKVFADSVAVKLDYTNTVYHGSDSVFLYPGKIDIPNFRLYDKFGNSAMLTGELTHNYFHDPSFTFRLHDANNFLCYDTSSDLNPDWYGTLFGTGSALLKGVPGLTDISADMTVGGNSIFTFVLNETEYAQDYQFLTFTDRRKEQKLLEEKQNQQPTAEDYKAMLKKKLQNENESLSKFGIDIRATVTPQVLFTLVMDPRAGDKITARGKGAMQVKYESDNDEMMMYGKYEIEEGNYNFSLQDIILRDFKIKEGSYISFNGNPLAADLDISATYRVNTNLSDLDKSFSTDRDLNRTNVPVDAVLSVNGNMQNPDITFDIELPTLTQDVERKVKSIISTDDMMNRQIIYLLALNRFYTPEYMGTSGNGGELAAVASSTISSQLSNMLGQLTDKFSVAPSFRSDKGDFSDIEVDVALSSKLLNNRLLINGNFGYRDRSNSSTTFVGDFDVEYLLSKNGNLRLKAYNHFNDQNYYLREALTTQGIGVVYRRDFDDWFTFLRKRKKVETESNTDK